MMHRAIHTPLVILGFAGGLLFALALSTLLAGIRRPLLAGLLAVGLLGAFVLLR